MSMSNFWSLGIMGLALSGLVACGGASEQSAETAETSSDMVAEDEGWVEMFQGNSKEGWTQLNGQADYEIQDGVVIGTTKFGEPNSFLATDKMYSDFILEYEVMVHDSLNSGVQIRSHQYEKDSTVMTQNSEGETVERKQQKGRVHGYQIEIDPSERAYSAGIYDEGRRGWLKNLDDNPEAREAFKNGEWNQYRVEAIGDTLRTFINGVPAAEIIDTVDASGFIALQVHATHHEEPMQVKWRNIRIKEM